MAVGNHIRSVNVYSYSVFSLLICGDKFSFIYLFILKICILGDLLFLKSERFQEILVKFRSTLHLTANEETVQQQNLHVSTNITGDMNQTISEENSKEDDVFTFRLVRKLNIRSHSSLCVKQKFACSRLWLVWGQMWASTLANRLNARHRFNTRPQVKRSERSNLFGKQKSKIVPSTPIFTQVEDRIVLPSTIDLQGGGMHKTTSGSHYLYI